MTASHPLQASADTVLDFWFSDRSRKQWFRQDTEFDDEIRTRFAATFAGAMAGELRDWTTTPEGSLALVIVLDQFPRNMFRGIAEAFAGDPQALIEAQQAVERGFDERLPIERRAFVYMPFMHSEKLADQEESLRLFRQAGLDGNLPHAEQHRDIIARFGRFPHRNAILGRESRAEERAYLQSDGAFRG